MKKKYKRSYWNAVLVMLQWRHNLTLKVTKKAIKKYRKDMKKLKVGLMIYHSDIEETAQGIVTGGGYNMPDC